MNDLSYFSYSTPIKLFVKFYNFQPTKKTVKEFLYNKFKAWKPFNPNDHMKHHTPYFFAVCRETIQPNLFFKSSVKFPYQPQDRGKHKDQTEMLKRIGLR